MTEYGAIQCTLDELLLIAGERWRRPLSVGDLALMTGIGDATLRSLLPSSHASAHAVRGSAQRITDTTCAALCAAFLCGVGELLRYVPPGGVLPRLGLQVVRRSDPPRGKLVRIDPLRSRIPEVLAPYPPAALAAQTGIPWSTWKRAKEGTRQINLDVLAATCFVANVDVDALLTAGFPFGSRAWYVREVRFGDHHVTFELSNGTIVSALVGAWPRLRDATSELRSQWHLTPDRQSVRWDALDVTISPRRLLE